MKHWKGLEAFSNINLGNDFDSENDSFVGLIIYLEQHDYDKGEFQDDCFKIKAIPLRANNLTSSPSKGIH